MLPHAAPCCRVLRRACVQAVAAASGRKEASIKADYEAEGDLGCVAAACKSSQRTMFKPAPLTVAGVLKTFREIAQ